MTDDSTTIVLENGGVLVFEKQSKDPIKGTEMTDELTLREKVDDILMEFRAPDSHEYPQDIRACIDAIATILEDTGSPAHMRVAAELRGE